MTMCGVCGRKIRANDGRRSFSVNGRQRLVHADRDRGFDCLDAATGWERGGADLPMEEAAALGRLDEGIGPLSPTKEEEDVSFKDSYNPDEAPKPEGGDFPAFATEDEKAAMVESGVTLEVGAVRFGTSRHGEVAHLDVTGRGWKTKGTLPDGSKAKAVGRTLTFSFDNTVVTRDHLITKLAEWLDNNPGELVPIQLVKQGRTILIELV